MTRTELIRALRRMKAETGSLVCLGCGHEHNCSTQGCAIIRAAAEELEKMLWVPVTERLPETACRTLACTKNGVIVVARYAPWTEKWNSPANGTTHWMPLPEPPGGGKV